MSTKDRDALVILSGGQDSTTSLYWAKREFKQVRAVTFDYGQRHRLEIESAMIVALRAQVVSHDIITIPPNMLRSVSFLTNEDVPVEHFESVDDMEHKNYLKENKLDSSFVPMRNTLFLTAAANLALSYGATHLVTGVTSADFAELAEFSWPWVGGFIDAEGCFGKTNESSYSLQIEQKDPEFIGRLGKWLKTQVPELTYSVYLRKGKDTGLAQLSIAKKSFERITEFITPHLHYDFRRNQAARVGVSLSEQAPVTDAYVVGFWEGDGGCYSSYDPVGCRHFEFGFYQKDPAVLELIREFLGSGYVGKHNEDIWSLRLSDGPIRARFLERFRKHFCLLGSLKKVTRYRHKVGLLGGGFNPPYPDCTPDFIYTYQKALTESLRQPYKETLLIDTPLMFLSKAQSILLAESMDGCLESLAYTHTSYDGKYPPTDMNHANVLRASGFEKARMPDPLVLRAWSEGLMELPATANYDLLRVE